MTWLEGLLKHQEVASKSEGRKYPHKNLLKKFLATIRRNRKKLKYRTYLVTAPIHFVLRE